MICGSIFSSPATWRRLFLYEIEIASCDRCYQKFERAEDSFDFSDFIGTAYEGAVDQVTSLYTYNDAMKNYLHQYKFLQDVALAGVFAREISELLVHKQGIVVPIPMHPEKLKERTFSQVEEFINEAEIPFQNLLVKTTRSVQGKKSKKERLEAGILFESITDVQPVHYILFDDIYTTGATIHHAAKVLKDAGAKSVEAITLIKG
ncbi:MULTISPECIES: ComF family protein [unclassified Psychrobacillus]|uniref:ComF family protein n=1 Tax=unclassified Psychrobacillus TaxID=2636677 RepID=UPI0012458E80|nr:ComF family protein [Psychrobacillus sp. AK 1817]QEY20507.1 ComF family protein [Psychrobacillus sp. AK 1817]